MAWFEGLDEEKRYKNSMPETQNRVTEGLNDLKYDLFGKQNGVAAPKNILLALICSVLTVSILHILIVQGVKTLFEVQDSVYIADAVAAVFSPLGLIFTLIFVIIYVYLIFMLKRATKTDYTTDSRGIKVSNIAVYGDTREMNEKEKEQIFTRTENAMDIPGHEDILGYETINNKDMLYAFQPAPNESNKNMILFGEPGSGKTVYYAIANIIQMAMRGISVITTDSKGDLYRATAWIMEHFFQYEVKILNVKPQELRNSDGCDFLKIIKEGKNVEGKAETVAATIIKNTEAGDKLDYWAGNELNLLKALILYVVQNPEMKAQGKDNLAGLFDYCTTHTLAEVTSDMESLDKYSPARQAYNIFAECEPKVQGQILNGMQRRLSMLSNPDLKGLVSADEIDLRLPMKKRCIYYVVIPDTESTYNFMATLFFSELFIELAEYSDSLSGEEKKKQIPVTCLLDEFYSTGVIPEFEKKISTVRSRKIALTLILQDIGQLEHMFPEKGHTTILNAIPTKLLLGTNDLETAKYFSDLMGTQTIKVEGERMKEKRANVVQIRPEKMRNDGFGKRLYMNPEEIIRKSPDEILLISKGAMPVKIKKWLSYNHPLIKKHCYNSDGSYKELITGQHIPEWVKEEIAEKEEMQKRREELAAQLAAEAESIEKPTEQKEPPKNSGDEKPKQDDARTVNAVPEAENDDDPFGEFFN